MTVSVRTTEDGFLVQKMMHIDCIQRSIDWQKLGITKEYIDEQSKLQYSWDQKRTMNNIDSRKKPDIDNQEEMDRFYVTELCMPYNPPPDDKDVFVYYNDIRALSGTAGYIRFRDGYVYGTRVVWRS